MNDPRLGLHSASSFGSDVACPGRRNLIKSLPATEETKDPDAERGKKIHTAWQTNNVIELDESELADYSSGIKYIDDVITIWKSDKQLVRIEELPREERLWLHNDDLERIASGQIDRWYSGTNSEGECFLSVIDGKSGFGTYVPASQRSWQLRVYAVLAWRETDCANIRVAYVKPKDKSDPTDYTDYDEAELTNSAASILYHIWMSNLPEAPRNAGIHCRFCAAKAFCREAAAWSMLPSVIAKDISPEATDENIAAFVATLSLPDLKKIVTGIAVRHKIEEACKARVKSLPAEELASIGYYLGKPTILRPIVNTKAAFDKLRDENKVPENSLFMALKFSNKELADVIRREIGMSADGAVAFIRETLKDYIQEEPCAPPLKELD